MACIAKGHWHNTLCQQQDRKLTIFSFGLVVWSIQILRGVSFLPNTVPVCFSFNIWLLKSRTYTGNIWPLTASPILCWLNLLKVDSLKPYGGIYCYCFFSFSSWNVTSMGIRSVLEKNWLDQSSVIWKPEIQEEKSAALYLAIWHAAFPNTHIHTSLLDISLTFMSSGSFLKLWLLKGAEVRLVASGCVCFPPFCLSTPSWIPCLSSSCTSGSLSSFFRFALLIEQSSENRLTRGRRDGDLSVVESGLWISVDEREEQ